MDIVKTKTGLPVPVHVNITNISAPLLKDSELSNNEERAVTTLATDNFMNLKQAVCQTWSVGWPLSLSALCSTGNNAITQAIVVATGKQDYLAATGLIFQGQLITGPAVVASLLGVAIFSGKLIGSANSISDQDRIAHLHKKVGEVVQGGLILANTLSVPVICFNLFSEAIFKSVGQEDKVAKIASQYFIAACWGMPAYISFNMLQQFLLATNYPKTVLAASFINTVLLLGMGLLFVNVAELDIAGMGYAFSITNWLSFLLLGACCVFHPQFKQYTLLERRVFSDYCSRVKQLFCFGFPIGLQVAAALSTFFLIGIQAGKDSVKVLATNAVPDTFLSISDMVVIRFSQANSILISRKVGAKNAHDAKLLGQSGYCYSAIAITMILFLFIAGHEALTNLVVEDKSTIDNNLCTKLFFYNAISQIGGVASSMLAGEARGYYYSISPSMINIFGKVAVMLIIGYALESLFDNNVESFYIGRIIGSSIAALGILGITLWAKRQLQKEISRGSQAN